MGKKILTFGDLKVGDSIHIIDQPDKISSFKVTHIWDKPKYILICGFGESGFIIMPKPDSNRCGDVFSDYDEAKSNLVISFPLLTLPPSYHGK